MQKSIKNNEKIVLYLGGGAMSGTYGAGVLKGLHDNNFVEQIEAIYAGSVGVLNTAYLLSNQAEIGPTIYFEDLQKGFLFPFNIFWGTIDLIYNRFIRKIKNSTHNVVNIDYVYNVIANIKPIDIEVIKNNPIEFYIKVLRVDTGETEYKSFKEHPTLDLLKAAITVKPYYFNETIVNGKRFIDGTIKEPLGIDFLINKYPNRKIVVILNEPINRGLRHYVKNFVEGFVSSLYPYNISLFKIFNQREGRIRKDIKTCQNNNNILLVYPNFIGRTRPRTTKLSVLKKTFDQGMIDSKKIINFTNET